MKNKNIKNKPQKCGRWLFLHSIFSKISWTPLLKGIHQLNPQNISSLITAAKGKKKKRKKRARKPSPIKTIYKKFILTVLLGFTEIEKWRRALGQDLFV